MSVIAFPGRACPQCGDRRFADRCAVCGFEQSGDDIAPGVYAARYTKHGCLKSFGSWKLWVDFYLPTTGSTFRRWYGLLDYQDGRMLAGARSHVLRELSDVLGLRLNPSVTHEAIEALRGKPVRVRVSRVLTDAKGKPLSAVNQYLKVETVLPPFGS